MKQSATEPVQSALAAIARRVAEIQTTEQHAATNGELLKLREETGDLASKAVLAEIAELQTLARVFPHRLEYLVTSLESDRKAAVQTTNEFISGKCNPRARQLEQRARTQGRAALQQHFPDPDLLERQVGQSILVMELQFAAPSITDNPANGAERYAEAALAAWAKLDEIEAKLA